MWKSVCLLLKKTIPQQSYFWQTWVFLQQLWRGGWEDEDGIVGMERKGKAPRIEKEEELKDEPQLMRFTVAEKKRDLKNSEEPQVLYKLYSLSCTTLSSQLLFTSCFSTAMFFSFQIHNDVSNWETVRNSKNNKWETSAITTGRKAES